MLIYISGHVSRCQGWDLSPCGFPPLAFPVQTPLYSTEQNSMMTATAQKIHSPVFAKTFWTLPGKGRVSVEMSQQPCLTFHAFLLFPGFLFPLLHPPAASFPVSTSSEELVSQPGWGGSKQKRTVWFCSHCGPREGPCSIAALVSLLLVQLVSLPLWK